MTQIHCIEVFAMVCMVLQMVVNPQPEPKAASQASKRPAKAQAKKETDRKQKKVKEPEAKQPGVPSSQHASTHLFRRIGLLCWQDRLC